MEKQIETLKLQLKEQEKLAALGILTAGIAHEIQNPLNFIINFSKLSTKLLDDLTDIVNDNKDKLDAADCEELNDIVADLEGNMEKIVEHGERAISIIQGILLVSRGKEDEYLPSDVNRIVKEYVWLSYHALRANHRGFNVSIHEQYQEGLPQMMVIPQDLSRAVLNLMNNACYTVWDKAQTASDDYQPTIDVSVTSDGQQVTITIADNGKGMTKEVQQHLFDNFYTTKPVGQGTGLGMGITRDIIENKHNGTLRYETEEGVGTRFIMTIPIRTK